jgi:hypothetical protein
LSLGSILSTPPAFILFFKESFIGSGPAPNPPTKKSLIASNIYSYFFVKISGYLPFNFNVKTGCTNEVLSSGSTLSTPPAFILFFNDSLIGSGPIPATKKSLIASNIYSYFFVKISGYLPFSFKVKTGCTDAVLSFGSILSTPPTLIRLFNDSFIGSGPLLPTKKSLIASNIYSYFFVKISGYLPFNFS